MDISVGKNIEKSFELYSFDIFNTLVMRKVALPEGIFLVMQEKIQNCENLDEILKTDFCKIRSDSEFFAREDSFAAPAYPDVSSTA